MISYNRECFPKIFHLVAQIGNISSSVAPSKTVTNSTLQTLRIEVLRTSACLLQQPRYTLLHKQD